MFAYIEQDSFLHRRNPMIKLLLIVVMTVIVCLSYFPVLPIITFLLAFLATWIAGKIPLKNLLRRLLVFIVVSVLFMVSMLVLRGLNDEAGIAQEIRGIPWNKGLISRFTSPFRVMLPLLCVAARRGERVACAMESRGLGRTEKRTYYKTTEVTKSDWLFLVIGVIIYIIIVMILVKYDLFKLNFASIK